MMPHRMQWTDFANNVSTSGDYRITLGPEGRFWARHAKDGVDSFVGLFLVADEAKRACNVHSACRLVVVDENESLPEIMTGNFKPSLVISAPRSGGFCEPHEDDDAATYTGKQLAKFGHLKRGDKLRVIARAEDFSCGWDNDWAIDMSVGDVVAFHFLDGKSGVNCGRCYPYWCLEEVKKDH